MRFPQRKLLASVSLVLVGSMLPLVLAACAGDAGQSTTTSDQDRSDIREVIANEQASGNPIHLQPVQSLAIDNVTLDQQGTWARIDAHVSIKEGTAADLGAAGIVILAQRQGQSWKITYPTNPEYEEVVRSAPESVLPQDLKRYLIEVN